MARFDLLLKGGTLVDPAAGVHARRDVGIVAGRVAAVAPDLPATQAAAMVDVSGLLVLPGLIDFHMHAYWGGTDMGVDPDRYCLPRGVTTVVDGGSAGAYNFLAFRRLVVDAARTRVFCFLHLATIGQVDVRVGELFDLGYIDQDATARVVEANRDVVVGLKLRLSRDAVGANSLRPLEIARGLADRLDVPIMVHIGDTEAPLAEILALLRAGDVVTHIFTPRRHGILDDEGQVIPELKQAVARGVVLDAAQGRMHLSYRVVRAAFAAGIVPETLSTDVVIYSARGEVRDLLRTMSRFLALGLNLDDVVRRTTANPARLLGRADDIGTLKVGAAADVAALALEEGEFPFTDVTGEQITGRQRLVPRLVLRAGQPVPVQEIE